LAGEQGAVHDENATAASAWPQPKPAHKADGHAGVARGRNLAGVAGPVVGHAQDAGLRSHALLQQHDGHVRDVGLEAAVGAPAGKVLVPDGLAVIRGGRGGAAGGVRGGGWHRRATAGADAAGVRMPVAGGGCCARVISGLGCSAAAPTCTVPKGFCCLPAGS
jgi:hypothetical protein